jgi:hypothetical protein
VVARPMDLRTVAERLDNGRYADPVAFATDVRLVFGNCLEYTPDPASPYHQLALRLRRIFNEGFEAAAGSDLLPVETCWQKSAGGNLKKVTGLENASAHTQRAIAGRKRGRSPGARSWVKNDLCANRRVAGKLNVTASAASTRSVVGADSLPRGLPLMDPGHDAPQPIKLATCHDSFHVAAGNEVASHKKHRAVAGAAVAAAEAASSICVGGGEAGGELTPETREAIRFSIAHASHGGPGTLQAQVTPGTGAAANSGAVGSKAAVAVGMDNMPVVKSKRLPASSAGWSRGTKFSSALPRNPRLGNKRLRVGRAARTLEDTQADTQVRIGQATTKVPAGTTEGTGAEGGTCVTPADSWAFCAVCQSEAAEPIETPCGHIFCRRCLRLGFTKPRHNPTHQAIRPTGSGAGRAHAMEACPLCRHPIAGFVGRLAREDLARPMDLF